MKAPYSIRLLFAIAVFCNLILVYQSQLPPVIQESVLPDLSLELDVGSPEEASDDGPFFWITKTSSRFILVNNTASFIKVTFEGVLGLSPCSNEVKVRLKMDDRELLGEIGRLAESYSFNSLVSLRPFERQLVKLDLNGEACPTEPSDGREILAKISGLALSFLQ
jgi:hypothetical protein